MAEQKREKPAEKIKEEVLQAARVESAPAPVRRDRAVLFQGVLLLIAIAFGVLTFLVRTMPSFAIDLQITRAIQLINFPFFTLLMSLINWPGFGLQSTIITGLIILLIYGFGLQWEAVMTLFAALFSTGVNLLSIGKGFGSVSTSYVRHRECNYYTQQL